MDAWMDAWGDFTKRTRKSKLGIGKFVGQAGISFGAD